MVTADTKMANTIGLLVVNPDGRMSWLPKQPNFITVFQS